MIKDLCITKLTEKDFEEAYEVFKVTIPDAFEKSGSGSEKEIIQCEILHKRNMLIKAINNENIIFFIAKYKGKVIGTISFGPCSNDIKECTNYEITDLGEIGSLFVLPQYQGNGVGSELIKYLMNYIKEKGIKEVCLDSGYEQAQKTWTKKFGVPYKVAENHWGPDIDNMVWLVNVFEN